MFNLSRLLVSGLLLLSAGALAGQIMPMEGCSRAEGQSIRQALRERYGHNNQDPNPSFVPWPDLRGAWVNESRALYVSVDIQRHNANNYWISIEIRRLCSGESLLAAGDIMMKGRPEDLNGRNFPKIALRNYGLQAPTYLYAFFSYSSTRPTLRVEGWDSGDETMISDRIQLQLP